MKAIKNLLAILFVAAACAGCQKDKTSDEDLYDSKKEEITVGIDQNSLSFDAQEHFAELKFDANFWWKLKVTPVVEPDDYEQSDWFTITPLENFGSRPVTVSLTSNIEKREREVKLEFLSKDGEVVRELTLKQAASPAKVELSSPNEDFSVLGGEYTLKLTTTDNWKIEKPSWITIKNESELTYTKGRDIELKLFIDYYIGDERQGDLKIISTSDTQLASKCSVKQSGVFEVSTPSIANGDNVVVTFPKSLGAIYYDIKLYSATGNSVTTVRYTPVANDNLTTYAVNISQSTIDWDGYVGQVKAAVKVYLSSSVFKESEKSTDAVHNLFDDTSGDGKSAAQTIIISKLRHWKNIQLSLGDFYYYKLNTDIDLSGYTNNTYTPIGTISAPFMGVFDGNNKTISNLNLIKQDNFYNTPAAIGIFGSVTNKDALVSEIKNLTLSNCKLQFGENSSSDITKANAHSAFALLVGRLGLGAKVSSCNITASTLTQPALTGTASSGTKDRLLAGSFVGLSDGGIISDCVISSSESNMVAYRLSTMGGIVGGSSSNATKIIRCVNNMAFMSGHADQTQGGILGCGGAIIESCINNCPIRIGTYTGGIVATNILVDYNTAKYNKELVLEITKTINNGDFRKTLDAHPNTQSGNYARVGGFIGYVSSAAASGPVSKIEECLNTGSILDHNYTGTETTTRLFIYGSFAGTAQRVNLKNCINTGNVTATMTNNGNGDRQYLAGGLCGELNNNGSANNCISTCNFSITSAGTYSSRNQPQIGGAMGKYGISSSVPPTECYAQSGVGATMLINDKPSLGNNQLKSEAELKSASLYASWDTSVWNIVNGALPTLKNLPK